MSMIRRLLTSTLLLTLTSASLLVGFAPRLCLAADGVIEINQTAALAGSITPSDGPGFPVTIDSPGSYRLTGNLTLASENTTGINVSSANVSIDLGGFSIIGPVTCTDTPVTSCSGSGSGRGINAGSSSHGLSISNGSIRGTGFQGIYVSSGDGTRLRNLHISEASDRGIYVATSNSVVSDVVVQRNESDGMYFIGSATIRGAAAYGNGDDGIELFRDGVVEGCSCRNNQGSGIQGSAGTTIRGNSVRENMDGGIRVSSGSLIVDNAVYNNLPFGISATSGSRINGNSVHQADGSTYGLSTGGSLGYSDNTIYMLGTYTGFVAGGFNAGGNVCNGAACP
jgi:hypothetical protein